MDRTADISVRVPFDNPITLSRSRLLARALDLRFPRHRSNVNRDRDI